MKSYVEWYPIIVMLAINFSFVISNILLKKIIMDEMNHLVFITHRQSISTVFLAPIAFFLERNTRPKLTPQILCYLYGRAKVIGILICLGGAFLLTFYKELSQTLQEPISSSKRNEQWIFGWMILFAGTLLWSSWFLQQSKIGKKYPCQDSSTVIMNFFSAIQSAILTFSIDRRLSIWIPKETAIDMLSVVYTGLVGSGLCVVGMSWCVKRRGPVFTEAFSPLIQVMAAILDVPILHEQLNLGSVMGSVIVIVGLYFLLWGKNKEMQKASQETGEKGKGAKFPSS
ncbi:unnamed protein product [Withania somnifera]